VPILPRTTDWQRADTKHRDHGSDYQQTTPKTQLFHLLLQTIDRFFFAADSFSVTRPGVRHWAAKLGL
jgi:hypothetical protein